MKLSESRDLHFYMTWEEFNEFLKSKGFVDRVPDADYAPQVTPFHDGIRIQWSVDGYEQETK